MALRDGEVARGRGWPARAATAGAPAATGRLSSANSCCRSSSSPFQAALGGADAVLAPVLVEHLDGGSPVPWGRWSPGCGCGGLDGLEGAGGLGLLHRLEHHIALEQLADVRLQLECGQLQKPDRLLQLRGHRQLLTQLQLQGRFQHGVLRKAGAASIASVMS